MDQYVALIELESSGYGVVFPDFPGCVSGGKNFKDAVRMAHEALAFHADGMREGGEAIPRPRTFEEVEKTWPDWPEWEKIPFAVAFITLLPRYESKIYSISMESSLMARIDEATKNRSAFLAEAAKRMLGIS